MGINSSGAVVSCLGGNGCHIPSILPGSEELNSIELKVVCWAQAQANLVIGVLSPRS